MGRYFAIRANGKTAHNNPLSPHHYVRGEPPNFPNTEFDYTDRCLQDGFARIGWPAFGDLTEKRELLDETTAYSGMKDVNRRQLKLFRQINVGDIIILPRKGINAYYIGTVTRAYHWRFELPHDPYECAHRVGVRWDQSPMGDFKSVRAEQMNLARNGYPFAYALAEIRTTGAIDAINLARVS